MVRVDSLSYPNRVGRPAPKSSASAWSKDRLKQAIEFGETIGSAAIMVVRDGEVIVQYGDVALKASVASVRKSLLNAIIGVHVDKGNIDLDRTLADLNIYDK